MKKYLFIISFIVAANLFAQTNDTLIVGKEISSFFVSMLPRGEHGREVKITKEDSLYGSFYYGVYKTNKKDTFYRREFNYLNKVIAEGKIVQIFDHKKFRWIRGRGHFRYSKIGLWKRYDFKKKEIQYLKYSIINRFDNPFTLLKIEKMVE